MSVLKNVVIGGGGAAGWLTSLHVKKILPESNITLIESEDIGILGAGEGSVPTLVQFLKDLEIDEDEFIRETNSTHKLGILFKNWNGDDKSYFHSFNVAHQQFDFMFDDDGEIGNPYIGYLYDNNLPFNIGEISEQFAMRFKSPYVKQKVNNTKQVANYSYHFDAHLLANFLRKVAESRGIVRVEGIVEDFIQNDNKDIMFFGTTMKQFRNDHNLLNDFEQEIPMYLKDKKIDEIISNLKLKKGEKNYLYNLKTCYDSLINQGIISKKEIFYLKAWISDCQKIIK